MNFRGLKRLIFDELSSKVNIYSLVLIFSLAEDIIRACESYFTF